MDLTAEERLAKGGLGSIFGLRRGQENQGSQTAIGRHAGLLNVVLYADVQDRDGAFICCASRRLFRSSNTFLLMADMGRKMALTFGARCLELKSSSDRTLPDLRFCKTLDRREDVAWISRNRRLARDFERYAPPSLRSSASP